MIIVKYLLHDICKTFLSGDLVQLLSVSASPGLTNVCYEKFVTHLLMYTVANLSRIFRNRR